MSWDVWKLCLHVQQNCKKWGLFKLLKSRVICKGAHQDETLWFLLLPRERRERFEGLFFNGYSDLNFSLSMSWFRRTFPYHLLVMQHEVTEKAGIYAWYFEQVKMSNKVWCGANPVLCVLRCRWSVPVLGEAVWLPAGAVCLQPFIPGAHGPTRPTVGPGTRWAPGVWAHCFPQCQGCCRRAAGVWFSASQAVSDRPLRWAEPQVRQRAHSLRHLWHINILELLWHFIPTKNTIVVKEIQGQTRW